MYVRKYLSYREKIKKRCFTCLFINCRSLQSASSCWKNTCPSFNVSAIRISFHNTDEPKLHCTEEGLVSDSAGSTWLQHGHMHLHCINADFYNFYLYPVVISHGLFWCHTFFTLSVKNLSTFSTQLSKQSWEFDSLITQERVGFSVFFCWSKGVFIGYVPGGIHWRY